MEVLAPKAETTSQWAQRWAKVVEAGKCDICGGTILANTTVAALKIHANGKKHQKAKAAKAAKPAKPAKAAKASRNLNAVINELLKMAKANGGKLPSHAFGELYSRWPSAKETVKEAGKVQGLCALSDGQLTFDASTGGVFIINETFDPALEYSSAATIASSAAARPALKLATSERPQATLDELLDDDDDDDDEEEEEDDASPPPEMEGAETFCAICTLKTQIFAKTGSGQT